MSDYLIHYGVKGMKWGVRKQRPSNSTRNTRRSVDKQAIDRQAMERRKKRNATHSDKAVDEALRYRQQIDEDDMLRRDIRDIKKILNDPTLPKRDRSYYQNDLDRMQGRLKGNTNRKAIIEKAKQETTPLYNNWTKQKYGSDQWFEAREKYAQAVDSYGTQYAKAAMKDFGNRKISDAAVRVMKEPGFMSIPISNSPYLNSDYHAIATPDGRDYDLEPAYDKWKAKRK